MEDVLFIVKFSSAATHDHTFLKGPELKKGFFFLFLIKGSGDLEEYGIPDNVDEAVLKNDKII